MNVWQPAKPANRLLASLSNRKRLEFLAGCEQVELDFAAVLCNSGERISHVYFPIGGFISLVTELDASTRLEVGIIGGYDLGNVDGSLAHSLLVAATELTSRQGIDRFVEIVRSSVA